MTFGFLPRSKGNNPFTKYLLAAWNINVLTAAFSLIIEKFTTHTAYMMYVPAVGMCVCGVRRDACLSKNTVSFLEFVWVFPPSLS